MQSIWNLCHDFEDEVQLENNLQRKQYQDGVAVEFGLEFTFWKNVNDLDRDNQEKLQYHETASERGVLGFRDVVYLHPNRYVRHQKTLQEYHEENWVSLRIQRRVGYYWLAAHENQLGKRHHRNDIADDLHDEITDF